MNAHLSSWDGAAGGPGGTSTDRAAYLGAVRPFHQAMDGVRPYLGF